MELKIFSPSEDGFVKEITWNHEEIKKEVSEKVEYYKNLVYTDAQIQDAKKDRATLNKFVQALEAKRKEIKKQCLAPYEDFEKKMKEIIAVVNEPIAMIDGQVKEYEKQKREEKLTKISEIFTGIGFPEWVTLDKIFDGKWSNVSVSLKSIQADMESQKERIENNITTLSKLPEFAFEAMQVYQTTLDMNKAISEGQRLSEIQKRKAEYEARKAAEKAAAEKAAAAKTEEVATHVAPTAPDELPGQMDITDYHEAMPEKKPDQPTRQWVGFKALLNVTEAQELAQFFRSRNIKFAPVEIN